MIIKKKVWSKYFQKIVNGEKTFEVRLADFACQKGDMLLLQEWDPKTQKYTGREITKKVSYIAKTKDMEFWSKDDVEKYGFQIISFT